MTEAEALAQARRILGRRAFVRAGAGDERCVVGRAEMAMGGMRNERAYGQGPTWAIALQRAAKGYQEMVNEARRGGVG